MTKNRKKKLRSQKNRIFLGLIKKYRVYEFGVRAAKMSENKLTLSFANFKNNYIYLIKIFYIFELTRAWPFLFLSNFNCAYTLLSYYAAPTTPICNSTLDRVKNVYRGSDNNIIIFSRPAKQLFLMFFKSKPIFIFTGGLMRIVMREKRKSSKKLYKVAVSLIKLFNILLNKKDFFGHGHLRLINVGNLRTKILNSLYKTKKLKKISYVVIKFRIDFTAQKLETRRAIKKYVKKRFKIR